MKILKYIGYLIFIKFLTKPWTLHELLITYLFILILLLLLLLLLLLVGVVLLLLLFLLLRQ